MSNDDKKIISEVLGLENSAAWTIVSDDPDNNLYMIHHRPEANLAEYGDIRGIVVDTEAKTVVCRSYGYTPTIVSDQLSIQEGDGKMHLVDNLGLEHVILPTNANIKVGFEGTLLQIFKHNGKVYKSTRKRLDSSRSRWGSSKTFLTMFDELGGPSDEVLFDPETKYSPYCHFFIIVHPDVLVVSKDNIGSGYLVYLGPKQMWDTDYETCPYKQVSKDGSLFEGVTQDEFNSDPRPNAGWIDNEIRVPKATNDPQQLGVETNIFSPDNISIEESNKHLMFGFYLPFPNYDKLDRRMLPGEFVVIQKLDENGHIDKTFRVESTSYSWRSGMRDNSPNLLYRFFQLVNGSYIDYRAPDGEDRFKQLYPLFMPFDKKSIDKQIRENGPYAVWPQQSSDIEDEHLNNKEGRMYGIWLAYLNAVPLHSQKEVLGFLDHLYKKRGELITWLRMLENRGSLDNSILSRRVIDLITTSRKFAQQAAKSGRAPKRGNRKLSVKDMTRNNIRNFISKEEGASLYRLIREMDKWKKDNN